MGTPKFLNLKIRTPNAYHLRFDRKLFVVIITERLRVDVPVLFAGILARADENCRAAFDRSFDKCKGSVHWSVSWALCWPMKVTFVCNLAPRE